MEMFGPILIEGCPVLEPPDYLFRKWEQFSLQEHIVEHPCVADEIF